MILTLLGVAAGFILGRWVVTNELKDKLRDEVRLEFQAARKLQEKWKFANDMKLHELNVNKLAEEKAAIVTSEVLEVPETFNDTQVAPAVTTTSEVTPKKGKHKNKKVVITAE